MRFKDIDLGRPVDVVLDLGAARAVGLEVLCGDDERRFLPLAAASVADDSILVGSPLVLLDAAESRFYHEEARSLRELRGTTVEDRGRAVGRLRDVVLGADGRIEEVVLDEGSGARQVALKGLVLSGHAPR